MNKDHQTHIHLETLKGVMLPAASRERIERTLLAYARFHHVGEGVRVAPDGRSIGQVPLRTSRLINLRNFILLKPMTAAIIAVTLVLSGGTSYAAEHAMPGDFLYLVKTEVNENVKSAFAISPAAEAKLQARLVAERLKEAEVLAARGTLSAEATAALRTRVNAHYEAAAAQSAKAETRGDYESSAMVRASLEGLFRTYADVLTGLNTNVAGNDGTSLISDIRTYASDSATAQATATAEVSTALGTSIEATVAYAAEAVDRAEASLTSARSTLETGAYAQAKVKLDEAIAAHTTASAALTVAAYADAYAAAQTAIRLATQVETMVESVLRLPADLGARVQVDIGEGAYNTGSMDTTSGAAEATSSNGSEPDSNTDAAADADLEIDTSVDMEVIEIEAGVDASLRSGLNL